MTEPRDYAVSMTGPTLAKAGRWMNRKVEGATSPFDALQRAFEHGVPEDADIPSGCTVTIRVHHLEPFLGYKRFAEVLDLDPVAGIEQGQIDTLAEGTYRIADTPEGRVAIPK